jgi:L-threonylcarbamoyladenylate synthase
MSNRQRSFSCPPSDFAGRIHGVSEASQTGATVLPTHTAALFDAAVKRAAALLRAGEVIALPTETVYGLAANAVNVQAVARIFKIKGRPARNPLIVHVSGVEMARLCVSDWPETAHRLAMSFWPGPLTLVLPRAQSIPDAVAAGGTTVGVRWPSHPFIQAVIRECGFPLAAPSANLSNQVSPTNAEHVRRSLGDQIPLIIDGGQSQVGIESTVIDLTTVPPQVLRPGMIHAESLAAVIPELGAQDAESPADGGLRSPGQLPRHYSPKARLVVLNWRDEADLRSQLVTRNFPAATVQVIAHSRIPSGLGWGGVSVIPHDAEAYARALYAELHRCDAEGASCIIVEALPEEPEWQAIADRLRRAAS